MRLHLSTQVRRRFRVELSLGRISSPQQSTLPKSLHIDIEGTSSGLVDHQISGSIIQRISGSIIQRIGGSADHRISGSADQRSSDQRISGSLDQRISGSADHRISGSADQRIIGSADHGISGSVEHCLHRLRLDTHTHSLTCDGHVYTPRQVRLQDRRRTTGIQQIIFMPAH